MNYNLASEKKLKKIYLHSTSFFIWNGSISWELFENYMINIYDAKYFWKLHKKEVDIILTNNQDIIPIEIKYKTQLDKNDFDGLNVFMKKYAIPFGYIITKWLSQQYTHIRAKSFLDRDIQHSDWFQLQ